MKLYGQWAGGAMETGRWIYPNGTYFEGNFKLNKPEGQGIWYFKNGNVMNGSYEHQKKGEGEEEEEPPAEDGEEGAEDQAPKSNINLIWHAQTDIASSAHHVNSVQQ